MQRLKIKKENNRIKNDYQLDNRQNSIFTLRLSKKVRIKYLSLLSNKALIYLNSKVASYFVELVRESIKLSRKEDSDNVSKIHIFQAARKITMGRTKKIYEYFGTIGGIIIGALISILLSLLQSGSTKTSFLIAIIILSIIGITLIVIKFTKS